MSEHDRRRQAFLKILTGPLPPVTTQQERDVLVDYVAEMHELADKLPADSQLRLAFRQHALGVQDRIDEYDEREP